MRHGHDGELGEGDGEEEVSVVDVNRSAAVLARVPPRDRASFHPRDA